MFSLRSRRTETANWRKATTSTWFALLRGKLPASSKKTTDISHGNSSGRLTRSAVVNSNVVRLSFSGSKYDGCIDVIGLNSVARGVTNRRRMLDLTFFSRSRDREGSKLHREYVPSTFVSISRSCAQLEIPSQKHKRDSNGRSFSVTLSHLPGGSTNRASLLEIKSKPLICTPDIPRTMMVVNSSCLNPNFRRGDGNVKRDAYSPSNFVGG